MVLFLRHKMFAYGLLLASFLAVFPLQGEATDEATGGATKSDEEIAAVFYHGGHGNRYRHYRGRDRFYGHHYYGRPYYGYPNYFYDDDSYYNERPYYDQGYGIEFRIR